MANRIVNRGSFRGRSGPRRETQWGGSTAGQTGRTALAAATAALFSRFSAAQFDVIGSPLTTVRNHGQLSVESDQSVAGETVQGAIGLAIVSEPAAAAGIGSIPTPITESDWDGWLMWMPFSHTMQFVQQDATGVQIVQPSNSIFNYDSKAMRKIQDQESLVFVIENENATAGLLFTWYSRTLFKLH